MLTYFPVTLFQSIYRLKKACHGELDEECHLLTPDQVVDRIFELVDENGDGECLSQLSDSLKCFMNDSRGLCQAAVMAVWGANVEVYMCVLLRVHVKKGRCDSAAQRSALYQNDEYRIGEMCGKMMAAPRHLGELSLDEFIDGARRDKWVMKMLHMDVNPGDWINERRRSSDS